MTLGTAGGSAGQPGGGGGLGDRLFNWLHSIWETVRQFPTVGYLIDFVDNAHGLLEGKPPDATRAAIDILGSIPLPLAFIYAQFISAITGKKPSAQQNNVYDELQLMLADPASYLAKKVKEIHSSAELADAAASVAETLSSGVFDVLRNAATKTDQDPLVTALGLMATTMAARTAANAVGTQAEILGLGQIKTVSASIVNILQVLAHDEIAALAIQPIFTSAIVPPAERFYNRQYRNARLPANDLAVLTGFSLINQNKFQTEMAEEGWRDEDIALIKALAQQRVTPQDAQSARDLGMIDDDELFRRLKFWRYSDNDAQFEMQLAARERHIQWNERMLSILFRQFLNYRLDDHKLESILRAMEFPEERVAVEMAAAKAARDELEQNLSVGEIEAAYKANVLSDVEAANYLAKIQVDPSGVTILLRTWKATLTKGGTHLNAATLERAYHDGLIDEQALGQKLRALGWNSEDARLLVQIASYQKPATPKPLSEANIVTGYTRGVLSRDEAMALLQKLDMTADTATLVLRIHTLQPKHTVKTLTAAEIAKAVELGAIGETEALNRFEDMGYSSEDAALLYVVLTTKVPKPVKTQPGITGG